MSSEATTYFAGSLPSAREMELGASASLPHDQINSGSSANIGAIDSSTEERSDEDLLHQVSNGSKEALSVLFHRYARPVFNVAQRILKDASEAEDLLQDLFVFVFERAALFDRTKSAASSWIIQMAYHRAIDRRRYLDARHHYDAQELREERLLGSAGQISINEITGREILHRLRNQLSTEQRQTLELYVFEGCTFREIAERTGQTLGNVRHHYYRSLDRLRSYIFEGKTRLK